MQSARIHPIAKALADSCNQLYQLGFTPGLSGQFSVWDEDLLWITPAGLSFRDVQPEHLLMVCPDGRLIGEETDTTSTHIALHQAIYQVRPQARAVLIANPPHLGKLALSRAGQPDTQTIQIGPSYTISLSPPQSDESRIAVAATVFKTHSILMEADFGVIITGIDMLDAWNQLEHLEAAAFRSHH